MTWQLTFAAVVNDIEVEFVYRIARMVLTQNGKVYESNNFADALREACAESLRVGVKLGRLKLAEIVPA